MDFSAFINTHDIWAIAAWGYPLLFLAMIIEGPFATMAGAFLASIGIFQIEIVYPMSVLGDIIGDAVLYHLGYFGGAPAIQKMRKFLKVKKTSLKKLEEKFEKDGAKIVFFVKATTGLAWITFILAGVGKMPFRIFVLYSLLGGILWSGLLCFLGYFFGYAIENFEDLFGYVGLVLFSTVAIFFSLRYYIRKKF